MIVQQSKTLVATFDILRQEADRNGIILDKMKQVREHLIKNKYMRLLFRNKLKKYDDRRLK